MIRTNQQLDAFLWLHCRVSNDLKCAGSGACGRSCARINRSIFIDAKFIPEQYLADRFTDGNSYKVLDYLADQQARSLHVEVVSNGSAKITIV